ncbi:hypothetical protein BDAP_002455 [Binucleata daphniae]
MNFSSKFVTQFAKKFKQNLQQEIKNNKNLTQNIENIARIKLNIINFIEHSKTIKMADKVLVTPLRISDSILLYTLDKTTEVINLIVNNQIQNMYKFIPQTIKDIDKIVDIPNYYGGNKYTKIKPDEHKYNRDEKSINYIENKLIPNILFNKKYKLKDEKSRTYINLLYDSIKNKYKLKEHQFYVIDCIDYRNVETNGYDKNENIGFTFDLQVTCKYFDKIFVTKKLNFSCFMKFDGFDKILQFDFQET